MRVKIAGVFHQVESWGKEGVLTTDGKKFDLNLVEESITEREYKKKHLNNSQKFLPAVIKTSLVTGKLDTESKIKVEV